MAGRRSTGAAATAVSRLILQDRERRITREDAERKERAAFSQRLLEAGIRHGQLQVDYSSGQPQVRQGQAGQMGGLQPTGSLGGMPVYDMPEDTSWKTIKTPQGTVLIRQGKRASQKFLPEGQAGTILGQAQPGTPLPSMRQSLDQFGQERNVSNIPTSPAGINTMNRVILRGQTESPLVINDPGAIAAWRRNNNADIPLRGQFVEGPGESAVGAGPGSQIAGGLIPRQQVIDLVRQPGAAPTVAQPSVPRAPSNDPIAQRIQQALAQGIAPERIAKDLRAKGIDPAQYGL